VILFLIPDALPSSWRLPYARLFARRCLTVSIASSSRRRLRRSAEMFAQELMPASIRNDLRIVRRRSRSDRRASALRCAARSPTHHWHRRSSIKSAVFLPAIGLLASVPADAASNSAADGGRRLNTIFRDCLELQPISGGAPIGKTENFIRFGIAVRYYQPS